MLPVKLKILVGTMSQTAYSVAESIEMACADEVESIEVHLLDDRSNLSLFEASPDVLHLVCTSTFHSGDVPDNAQALYASFDAEPRYLGGVNYGVIALGDSAYDETFAMGGKRFDEKLADLGATRLGDILILDASETTDQEDIACEWVTQWLRGMAS